MDTQHDEINLIRLVRRLEKSVTNGNDWEPSSNLIAEDIWLTAQKTLQKVKFARRLVKNIEVNDFQPSPKRIKQLNDTKIKLDRVDSFLRDVQQSSKPKSHRPDPILPKLPIPEQPPSKTEPSEDSRSRPVSPPPYSESKEKADSTTHGLSISLSKPEEIPSPMTSALLPSDPPGFASTSSFKRSSGAVPSARQRVGAHGSTALHEELSSQLEIMAQQLKRNAIHFSTSMEKDKAVVEDAQLKLEGNHDVMLKERLRLRDRSSASRSNTCMVMGIMVLVLLLFTLMVGIIRFL